MEDNKLEAATKLKHDLNYFDSIIGNLEHANRTTETPYRGEEIKRVGIWKKLFPFCTIRREKNDVIDSIRVDAVGVSMDITIDTCKVQDEEVSIELGKARADILYYMIKKLKEVETFTKDKYKSV